MTRVFWALVALSGVTLACMQQITPPVTPTTIQDVTPTQIQTDTPTAIPTASPTPSGEDTQTATVRAALVNVRTEPNGEVSGQIEAGQQVTILGFDEAGDWAQIENPSGWVWAGCLDGVNEKGCEAK